MRGMRSFIDALPVIANALGNSFGVKVVTGARACTNGSTIYLPPLDLENPASKVLGLGYTVHEAAHVRETDFTISMPTALGRHVANILEDVRIEKLMALEFPGTEAMLQELFLEMVKQDKFGKPEESKNETEYMLNHMLYGLRFNVLGQVAFEQLAQNADKLATDNLPKGMLTKLNALMFRVEECETTADVHSLTESILTMMEEEAKKEEEKAKQEAQQQQPDPQGQGDGDQQQQQQPQSGDSGGGQQGDDDDQQQSQAGDSDEQQGDTQQNATADKDDQGGSSPEADAIRSMLEASDEDWQDVGDTLAEMLNGDAVPYDDATAVTPFQTQKVHGAGTDVDSVKQRVAGATNALRRKMQNLLQARTFSRTSSDFTGTKLNFKTLHRAPLMGPVFKRVKEGTAVDTAIALLVDLSTSMEGGKDKLALDAALATMMAFQRPNVATAAFAFPASEDDDANVLLKTWHEQPAAAIPRNEAVSACGTTPLAQALFGAGVELCRRKEKRKILFVVTDGAPNNKGQAAYVINKARETGIEVLALGIKHDVNQLFGNKQSTRIDTIDMLPQSMIGLLEQFV